MNKNTESLKKLLKEGKTDDALDLLDKSLNEEDAAAPEAAVKSAVESEHIAKAEEIKPASTDKKEATGEISAATEINDPKAPVSSEVKAETVTKAEDSKPVTVTEGDKAPVNEDILDSNPAVTAADKTGVASPVVAPAGDDKPAPVASADLAGTDDEKKIEGTADNGQADQEANDTVKEIDKLSSSDPIIDGAMDNVLDPEEIAESTESFEGMPLKEAVSLNEGFKTASLTFIVKHFPAAVSKKILQKSYNKAKAKLAGNTEALKKAEKYNPEGKTPDEIKSILLGLINEMDPKQKAAIEKKIEAESAKKQPAAKAAAADKDGKLLNEAIEWVGAVSGVGLIVMSFLVGALAGVIVMKILNDKSLTESEDKMKTLFDLIESINSSIQEDSESQISPAAVAGAVKSEDSSKETVKSDEIKDTPVEPIKAGEGTLTKGDEIKAAPAVAPETVEKGTGIDPVVVKEEDDKSDSTDKKCDDDSCKKNDEKEDKEDKDDDSKSDDDKDEKDDDKKEDDDKEDKEDKDSKSDDDKEEHKDDKKCDDDSCKKDDKSLSEEKGPTNAELKKIEADGPDKTAAKSADKLPTTEEQKACHCLEDAGETKGDPKDLLKKQFDVDAANNSSEMNGTTTKFDDYSKLQGTGSAAASDTTGAPAPAKVTSAVEEPAVAAAEKTVVDSQVNVTAAEENKAENDAAPQISESVKYQSLREACLLSDNYFDEETYTIETPEEKSDKLNEQVALLMARESNDPMYTELLESAVRTQRLQEELVNKYFEEACQKADLIKKKGKK